MTLSVVLCGAAALALGTIAVTRRGKNLPGSLAALPGEREVGEWEVSFSERPKRPAAFVTQVYVRGRARLTSHRLVITQPALFTGTHVLRYVLHLRSEPPVPAGWRDGFSTFAVLPPALPAEGTWLLTPVPEAEWLSGGVLLRGPPELAAAFEALAAGT